MTAENLTSELITTYTSVSLNNLPYYHTTITVGDTRLLLSFGYQTRTNKRWLIIEDDSSEVVLSQVFLSPLRRCELGFTANQNNLNGYVTLEPKTKGRVFESNYDYLNWANDFKLMFVTMEQEVVDKLKINGRKVLVGN